MKRHYDCVTCNRDSYIPILFSSFSRVAIVICSFLGNPSCTAIIYTLPPLIVCLSAPTSHGSTSYWLPLPTSPYNPTYRTGIYIYTLYIMSLTFFIHVPMKMEPIRSSETSDIKTQTPGNYPKKEHITRHFIVKHTNR